MNTTRVILVDDHPVVRQGLLKQLQYSPMPMEEQVVSIFACTPRQGRDSWVRPYELADLGRYEQEMLEYVRDSHAEILEAIRTSEKLDPDTERKLAAALDAFAEIFQPAAGSAAA